MFRLFRRPRTRRNTLHYPHGMLRFRRTVKLALPSAKL